MAWWANRCEPESVIDDYWKYVDSVRGVLPSIVTTFIDRHTLHDAVVRRFEVSIARKSARLSADGFDRELNGSVSYDLRYEGVDEVVVLNGDEDALGGPAGLGDLGYDEFEPIDGGLIEHRLLFSTGVEIAIRFRAFAFSAEPRPAASGRT
jgi:hypothetical protein